MLALALVGPAKGAALRGESGELVRLGIIALFCLWGGFALTLMRSASPMPRTAARRVRRSR